MYEAIECQQFVTSTFAVPAFCFTFLVQTFQRLYNCVFQKMTNYQMNPIFFQKEKNLVIQVIKLDSIILAIEKRKFCALRLCLLISVS